MSSEIEKFYLTLLDSIYQDGCNHSFQPITFSSSPNLYTIGLAYARLCNHALPTIIIEFYDIKKKIFVPILQFNCSDKLKEDLEFKCFHIAEKIHLDPSFWSYPEVASSYQQIKSNEQDDIRNCKDQLLIVVTDTMLCGVNFITRQLMFAENLNTKIEDDVIKCICEYSESEREREHQSISFYILTKHSCRLLKLNHPSHNGFGHQLVLVSDTTIHRAKSYLLLNIYSSTWMRESPMSGGQLIILSCSDSTLRFVCAETMLDHKLDSNCISLVENASLGLNKEKNVKKVFIYGTSSMSLNSIGLLQRVDGELIVEKYWTIDSHLEPKPNGFLLAHPKDILDNICVLGSDTFLLLLKREKSSVSLYRFVDEIETHDNVEWSEAGQISDWKTKPCLISTCYITDVPSSSEISKIYQLTEMEVAVVIMSTGHIYLLRQCVPESEFIRAISTNEHLEHQIQFVDRMCESSSKLLHGAGVQYKSTDSKRASITMNLVISPDNISFLAVESDILIEEILITSTAMTCFYNYQIPEMKLCNIFNNHDAFRLQQITNHSMNHDLSSDSVTSWVYIKTQPLNKLSLPIKVTEGYAGKIVAYLLNEDSDKAEFHVAYTSTVYVHPLCLHHMISSGMSETIGRDAERIVTNSDIAHPNSINIKGDFDILTAINWVAECLPKVDVTEIKKSLRMTLQGQIPFSRGLTEDGNEFSYKIKLEYKSIILDTTLKVNIASDHLEIISENAIALSTVRDFILSKATKESTTVRIVPNIDDEGNLNNFLSRLLIKLSSLNSEDTGVYHHALDKMIHTNPLLDTIDRCIYDDLIKDINPNDGQSQHSQDSDLSVLSKKILQETYRDQIVSLVLYHIFSTGSVSNLKSISKKMEQLDSIFEARILNKDEFFNSILNLLGIKNESLINS